MNEALIPIEEDDDIARHEVSEDGVHWRPFDPATDRAKTLHRRIVFAALPDDQRDRIQPFDAMHASNAAPSTV
jgi:hypothetical protein